MPSTRHLVTPLAAMLAAVALAAPAQAFPTFAAAVPYPTTSVGDGDAVHLADLNHDGHLDAVVPNYNDPGRVGVLLGTGTGTFGGPTYFDAGVQPDGATIADFNEDGNPDILATNYGANTMSLLRGKGDGTFKDQRVSLAGRGAFIVRAADMNADGHKDAVIADYSSSRVEIQLGDGAGHFTRSAQEPVAKDASIYGMVVADFNGDGKRDVATTNYGTPGKVSVLLGDGQGGLGSVVNYPTGVRPLGLAAGDLNKDGKVDLVSADSDAGTLSVLRGRGDGTFRPPLTIGVANSPKEVATTDLDKDGKRDLVYGSTNGALGILPGNGDASFGSEIPYSSGATGVTGLAIGKLNDDPEKDLVAATTGPAGIAVLLQQLPCKAFATTRC